MHFRLLLSFFRVKKKNPFLLASFNLYLRIVILHLWNQHHTYLCPSSPFPYVWPFPFAGSLPLYPSGTLPKI